MLWDCQVGYLVVGLDYGNVQRVIVIECFCDALCGSYSGFKSMDEGILGARINPSSTM